MGVKLPRCPKHDHKAHVSNLSPLSEHFTLNVLSSALQKLNIVERAELRANECPVSVVMLIFFLQFFLIGPFIVG